MFCVRQVYFAKSWQQLWARVNQPFIPFIYHIWGETVLWGNVFIIQTSDRKQNFTILQYKLHPFNILDYGSARGLLAKPLKNFQNHLYGHPVLTFVVRAVTSVWMNINRVTLQQLCLFFIQWFNAGHFEYSCKGCSPNDWKQSAQRFKLQERLLTINKRNRIRWNI